MDSATFLFPIANPFCHMFYNIFHRQIIGHNDRYAKYCLIYK